MTENKSFNTISSVLLYYGKAYLKLPRVLIEQAFSKSKKDKTEALIHLFLFVSCNYANGYLNIAGKRFFCSKGELISTYADIAYMLGLSDRTVRRYVDELVKKSYVEVNRCEKHMSFKLCGYEAFTAQDEPKIKEKKEEKKASPKVKSKNEQVAERRAEEEQLISHGNKPRTDLLNYS